MEFNIKTTSALEALNKNLEEHIKEFKEANDVWVEKVQAALDKLKDSVERNKLKASHDELFGLFHRKPVDNRADYSRLIGAMKLAIEAGQETLTVDEYEYDRIFNDNFDWRVGSKTTNAFYSNAR